jgi:hypothetical protein
VTCYVNPWNPHEAVLFRRHLPDISSVITYSFMIGFIWYVALREWARWKRGEDSAIFDVFDLRKWNSPFVLIAALSLIETWRAVLREFQLGVLAV